MDYGQRITEAQNASNASMQTYNQYGQQADAAGTKYNGAFDSSKNYGDIYQQARDQYMNTDEINAARGTYQNARSAVDQMNTTLNKLPESIRQQYGGTGLTEAQRARAMGDQHTQMANTYNMLNKNYQNASADYNDLANRSVQEVQNVAAGNYQRQQDQLNALQSTWSTLLGQRNTAYGQNQTDRGMLADQYAARDSSNLAQQQMELDRWKEQQANARSAADRNAEFGLKKYLMDRQETAATNERNYQAELAKQLSNAQRLANATLASNKASAAAKAAKKEFGTGNFFNDYGSSIAKYGPLALFGKGWGW